MCSGDRAGEGERDTFARAEFCCLTAGLGQHGGIRSGKGARFRRWTRGERIQLRREDAVVRGRC